MSNPDSSNIFYTLTARPKLIMLLSGLLVLFTAAGLTQLSKDTSVRAFIPTDHESVVTDDRINETFGLSDTLAVAVVTNNGESIFTPAGLGLVAELTETLATLSNVRSDRIASLASESSISGDDGMVLVDPYTASGNISAADAAAARERWSDMPPHIGTLAAEDGSGAVILAELEDPQQAVDTYLAALELLGPFETESLSVHIAGPAAVSAFLSKKIDGDARVMQPLVFLMVLGFIYAAFRRAKALLAPFVVLLGAAGGAMGLMGWAGISYFAITNALPVILIAIAVADAIHILSYYYQLRAAQPDGDVRSQVITAMSEMARPITLTTITTMAGFVGIGIASIMPPITYFAWFASLGVALAWLFSMVTLPNALVLLQLAPSPAFASWSTGQPNALGEFFQRVSTRCAEHYKLVLGVFALITLGALYTAQGLQIDRSQVENFDPDEPIRIADELINERFAGTSFLDVVIDTDEPEGLLRADRMAKLVELQRYMESLEHIELSVGITDYLALLHQAVNELENSDRILPDEDDAIAQYLLVYEVSGDPTDFEEEIDSDYQSALIRGVLDSVHFSKTRDTVEMMQSYIDREFNEPGMRATLGGDVNITYHWMSRLESSHFQGVALSLIMVLGMAIAAFRSFSAGLLAVLPVTFTIVMIYALMAGFGVYLEPATSMFAAISVGVGVDFAIHLVDRLRIALRLNADDLPAAIAMAVPGTARACFFNATALGVGFSVMLASGLPMLQRFGGLVASAAVASFLIGLIVVPACYAAALALKRRLGVNTAPAKTAAKNLGLLLGVILCLPSEHSIAESPTGLEIAAKVAERSEGELATRTIEMTLIDRRGREKLRTAIVMKNTTDEQRQTRITYLTPKSVRNTTFLSHDALGADAADQRWLYIPAARKVRRIPASDRGDYFLGTDFTYEDIQGELKFDLNDYDFVYESQKSDGDTNLHQISGTPKTADIARELGYGAFTAIVNEATWLPIRIEFFDTEKEPLKTIEVSESELVDGIWTATRINATHHQTNHRTVFVYRDISYPETLPENLFQSNNLQQRLPSEFISD